MNYLNLAFVSKAFSIIVGAFGCFVAFEAYRFGLTSPEGPGPGVFPLLAGLLMALGSLWSLLDQVRTPPDGEPIGRVELVRVATIVLVSSVFVLLAEAVGFYVLLPFLIVSLSCVIRRPEGMADAIVLLAMSLAISAFCYVVFNLALGLLIPVVAS